MFVYVYVCVSACSVTTIFASSLRTCIISFTQIHGKHRGTTKATTGIAAYQYSYILSGTRLARIILTSGLPKNSHRCHGTSLH